jgi:hypothetical protein
MRIELRLSMGLRNAAETRAKNKTIPSSVRALFITQNAHSTHINHTHARDVSRERDDQTTRREINNQSTRRALSAGTLRRAREEYPRTPRPSPRRTQPPIRHRLPSHAYLAFVHPSIECSP